MNWDAIGAIGELVGAIAVVVTLIYLAAQIRHNTKVATSATRQAISVSATAPAQNFFTDPEFRKIFNDHISGKELNSDQHLYLQVYCYVNFRLWENIHYQYRTGMLSEEEWTSFRKNLKAIAQISAWQDNWKREGEVYTEAFRKEMNVILDELKTDPTIIPDSVIHPQNSETS